MDLEKFFNPQSVVVVGASREKGKVGYEILVNLINGGFPGRIYAVNPKATEIEGIKCYPDLESLGEIPDLVIIVVPAKLALNSLERYTIHCSMYPPSSISAGGRAGRGSMKECSAKRGSTFFSQSSWPMM